MRSVFEVIGRDRSSFGGRIVVADREGTLVERTLIAVNKRWLLTVKHYQNVAYCNFVEAWEYQDQHRTRIVTLLWDQ